MVVRELSNECHLNCFKLVYLIWNKLTDLLLSRSERARLRSGRVVMGREVRGRTTCRCSININVCQAVQYNRKRSHVYLAAMMVVLPPMRVLSVGCLSALTMAGGRPPLPNRAL
jgi:hypothetical protein